MAEQELIVTDDRRLAMLDEARRAVINARTVEDAKAVRDVAEAMRKLTKERDISIEAQNEWGEIKVRAERKIGELLKGNPPRRGNPNFQSSTDTRISLADMGLSWDDSSKCQKLAGISGEAFDSKIREVCDSGKEITTAAMLRYAAELNKPAIPQAKHFNDILEADAIEELLIARLAKWPVAFRSGFFETVRQIINRMEEDFNDAGGQRADSSIQDNHQSREESDPPYSGGGG